MSESPKTLELADLSLEELEASDLIPLTKIESLINQPLVHEVLTGDLLKQVNINGRPEFNTPIEKSISRIFLNHGNIFPATFQNSRNLPTFYEEVCQHLEHLRQKGIEVPTPPSTQIIFRGRLDGYSENHEQSYAYKLHLAEILQNGNSDNKELYLHDIYLSNPVKALASSKPQISLGQGIFDQILKKVEEYAKEQGYPAVSLEAAFPPQLQLFASRGYSLENNIFAQAAITNCVGYPMRKLIF